jgi:four helix bundle protein
MGDWMNDEIINRNKNINRGYRKLEVWIEAVELYIFVKQNLNELKTVSFKVKAQVEDSVFSVHSNIAEGYCRRHLRENIQHNYIALASLGENYSQIFALMNSNDIDQDWFDKYDEKHYSLENKLISYNKSQIKYLKQNSEWKNDYIIKELINGYGIDNNEKNDIQIFNQSFTHSSIQGTK